MNLHDAQQRMLALVRSFEEHECRELHDRAAERAAALRHEAWVDGRRRLHEAIVRERARARDRLQHARAELETERRRYRQRADAHLLLIAWERLETGLIDRWHGHSGRRTWIAHAVQAALATLPDRPWVVSHPKDWGAADGETFAAACPHRPHAVGEFRVDESLRAGLIIRCDGVVLDMTCHGLLLDREWVESRLLALIAAEGRVDPLPDLPGSLQP